MQNLIDLIDNEEYIQAKQFIIDNRDRINDIADCLLEIIGSSKPVAYWDTETLSLEFKSKLTKAAKVSSSDFDVPEHSGNFVAWDDCSADPSSDIKYLRGHVKRCIEDSRNSRKENHGWDFVDEKLISLKNKDNIRGSIIGLETVKKVFEHRHYSDKNLPINGFRFEIHATDYSQVKDIAKIIHWNRTVDSSSFGNYTCSFEYEGEIIQERFDLIIDKENKT